ncbi:MAG TPA: hypothetical protein VG649_20410 [Candidatus Angelobacter sp.]|jgi:hypothetical protein|nr:hypothetical protein [Candidatus Angelobacter sp.]
MVGNDSAVAFGDLDVFSASPYTHVWVYSLVVPSALRQCCCPWTFLEP